jgi:membrane fusion protein (multidrug efflux system)
MTAIPLRDVSAPPAPAPVRKRALPFSRRTLIVVSVALAVAAAGAIYIAIPKATVSTDAAYVEADSSVIAPRVRGLVARVFVDHDQVVKKGDPLVALDPEEFDARVSSATADLANAEAGVDAAKAAFDTQAADEGLAAANVRAADTTIAASDAQRVRADADLARFDQLVDSGAVSKHEAELARATALSARSDAEHSRAVLAVSRSQATATLAKRAALRANLAAAEAAVARAQAALDLAKQDQGHAIIRAPIDGVVGDRQVQEGDYLSPGTRLMTVAPMNALYVTANFKETQVARMLVGQTARVEVDALPGKALKGHVESFAPGTGSQFSLLPFEPGTGNFTKIVQRVPVRIALDPGQPGMDRLRPGLSSTVTVHLGR